MIDFNNLSEEQKAFFNEMWESHQQEDEQSTESVKAFQCYVEQRRKQEDEQAKATEHLKALMR